MNEANIAQNYPMQALEILSCVIDENDPWLSKKLKSLLQSIQSANVGIAQEERFKRLVILLQKSGHDWP